MRIRKGADVKNQKDKQIELTNQSTSSKGKSFLYLEEECLANIWIRIFPLRILNNFEIDFLQDQATCNPIIYKSTTKYYTWVAMFKARKL